MESRRTQQALPLIYMFLYGWLQHKYKIFISRTELPTFSILVQNITYNVSLCYWIFARPAFLQALHIWLLYIVIFLSVTWDLILTKGKTINAFWYFVGKTNNAFRSLIFFSHKKNERSLHMRLMPMPFHYSTILFNTGSFRLEWLHTFTNPNRAQILTCHSTHTLVGVNHFISPFHFLINISKSKRHSQII